MFLSATKEGFFLLGLLKQIGAWVTNRSDRTFMILAETLALFRWGVRTMVWNVTPVNRIDQTPALYLLNLAARIERKVATTSITRAGD